MSNATELMRRAEECLRHAEYPNDYREEESDELRDDIRLFLAAETESESEPVAWMWLALEDGDVITQYGPYLPNLFRKTGTPLYTRPEPAIRKPMTEEEIDEELETNEYYCAKSFADGVRWAEKHHFGIGANPSDPDSIDLQSRCRGDKL